MKNKETMAKSVNMLIHNIAYTTMILIFENLRLKTTEKPFSSDRNLESNTFCSYLSNHCD